MLPLILLLVVVGPARAGATTSEHARRGAPDTPRSAVIRDALYRAIERDPLSPIVLAIEDGSRRSDIRVAANRGVMYPHFERNTNPDVIAEILEARATSER